MLTSDNSISFGRRVSTTVAALCLLSLGCDGARQPPNEKPVSPVTGTVLVNGNPVPGIRLKFHTKTPADTHRVFPKALTDAEGKFAAWTYRKDDGLAAGEYSVTFLDHSQSPPGTRESQKVDRFDGKYARAETSEHTIMVPDNGEPLDIGTIELTY